MKKPGPVIALCGNLEVHGHAGRVRGPREALRDYAPRCGEVQVLRGDDDLTKSERLLLKAFRARPDLAGLYNAGAANPACNVALTAGVLKGEPIFIGQELTHETRPMLRSGAMTMPYRSNISFQLYSRENITGPDGPPAL